MPIKKSRRKTNKSILELEPKIEEVSETPPSRRKFFFLGAAVIVIALLLFLGKSLILAAVVNGSPIFRYQLDRELEKAYGQQTLDNLVTENLIFQEAQKQNIKISKSEIQKEIDAVTKTLPQGTDLNSALKAQNMTMNDFTKQIIIKLTAEKILNPKITITDQEIADFASKSASMLSSSDSAKQKEEARTILEQQKLGQAFSSWIDEIKSKAKILTF